MMHRYGYKLDWLLYIGLFAAFPAVAQEAPQVSIMVEDDEVYVGETFLFQIHVRNVEEVEPPDLASLTEDFSVEYAGARREDSQSFGIVNGRTTRFVRRKVELVYRLVAQRPGTLEIPSVKLEIGGRTYTTDPATVRARPPEQVDEFQIESRFSKDTCYVGEPVTLTTTFYIGQRVRSFSISLPAITSDAVHGEPLAMPRNPNREYYQIPVNGQEVIAERSDARMDGRQYVTLTFKHVVVPRTAGELALPDTTVSVDVPVGEPRRRSPLSGLSILGSQQEYREIVVPGNSLALSVKPVPETGKPANFSGLIGAFDLATGASPTIVNAHDPITLNVVVEGSHYLNHFELPPLQQQPALAADFKIPADMAPGRVDGNRKVFTQTIRAESSDVTEIPPLTLTYFDTDKGEYATATSDPIPLTVHETEWVTAEDAEGHETPVETVGHVAVESGIAHNFTGAGTLRQQRFAPEVWLRTPGSWLLLLAPPGLYGMLAGARAYRRMGGIRLETRKRKQARARLEAALDRAGSDADVYNTALDALRAYLGAKLNLNPNALTYSDAEAPLRRQGAGSEHLARLKEIFEACEAHRYAAGTAAAGSAPDFLGAVRDCVRALDQEIR